MQITSGVANLNGMLVYNTTATLGVGIYTWSGSAWVRASLPVTAPSDSGKFLMSNGSGFSISPVLYGAVWNTSDSIVTARTPRPVSWTISVDTTVTVDFTPNRTTSVKVVGSMTTDLCVLISNVRATLQPHTQNGFLVFVPLTYMNGAFPLHFRCYRAAF